MHSEAIISAYFDREQFEKVFFNLLGNAFKFTPENGAIIVNIEQQENNIVITVTDNGRGISSEHIDKLFNNFFQIHDHGQQNTGYGIGLALSKNIIGLHKGTIDGRKFNGYKQCRGKNNFYRNAFKRQ